MTRHLGRSDYSRAPGSGCSMNLLSGPEHFPGSSAPQTYSAAVSEKECLQPRARCFLKIFKFNTALISLHGLTHNRGTLDVDTRWSSRPAATHTNLEFHLSKKPTTTSKRASSKHRSTRVPKTARRQEMAARAHRNKQHVVRSPKESHLGSFAAGPVHSPNEVHGNLKREASVDNRARAAVLETILQASLQNNNPYKGFDSSSLLANMQAYQAKLLEVAQAEMQFAFDFIQRLVTIKSPFEFWAVIAEFSGRRIIMTGKQSKELTIDRFRVPALGR